MAGRLCLTQNFKEGVTYMALMGIRYYHPFPNATGAACQPGFRSYRNIFLIPLCAAMLFTWQER
jgi:hypothetical protein